jgi:hypothetical protein
MFLWHLRREFRLQSKIRRRHRSLVERRSTVLEDQITQYRRTVSGLLPL